MLKRYLRLDILFILLLTLLLLAWLSGRSGTAHLPESTSPTGQTNPLSISQDGSQTTANVSGADLQSAEPPATSTTNASLSPQQATPYAAQ